MRLPNGYTEVQYIQSSGTQWIDTGVKPDQTYMLKIKFQTEQSSGGIAVSDANWQSNGFGIWCNAAAFGNKTIQNMKWYGATPIEIELSQQGLFANENLIWTPDTATFTVPANMTLFALNRNGSIAEKLTCKIYFVKLLKAGNLVRDFVPCIDPTGAIGLYDLIDGKFYRNAGTGVFLAGPLKVTLPKGYTQLEYIQSTGIQYIDTEFNPSSDTRVDMTCEPTTAGTWKGIFGARKSASVDEFGVDVPSATEIRSMYGTESKSLTVSTILQKFSIIKNKNICTVNGTAITNTKQNFTTSFPIRLFDKNSGGSAWGQISMKLYSCQIYDNGMLVRNFIPCKNPSGVAGLYDLIGKKFYTNAVAGDFTAGPEVIWPSNDAIYVKVNGIWKQIDGIKFL